VSTACERLLEMWSREDPFDYDSRELLGDQLAAAAERFAERRQQISILDRRANDEGVDAITALEDLVPLLFSHTTYKSYPDAFVRQGRWDRLCAWLQTLSTRPVRDIDLDGVADIDDWMARLHEAGHLVMASSGTTGRTSFINLSPVDRQALATGFLLGVTAVSGGTVGPTRTAFLCVPRGLVNGAQLVLSELSNRLGGAEVIHLSDQPLRAAEIARLAQLRSSIADGTATPDEIAAADQAMAERAARSGAEIARFVDQILERHEEPLFIGGSYGLLWTIVKVATGRGLARGLFHRDTILYGGGGLKGVDAPVDFLARIGEFFGGEVIRAEAYGMTEFNTNFPKCSAGCYHVPPTTLPLVLDKAGARLLGPGPGGEVEGRMAALDLTVDGRWGGVISGDRVLFRWGECACGRRSPVVADITRYSELPEGDDKLSCAGTIDSYVRGSIGAGWA
jgi:hypothetical protein